MPELIRCPWAETDPLHTVYHDTEWGVPVHDDQRLFEFITLEGAQAGLSWLTILRRRQGYRDAFADFDPQKVASFNDADVARLLADPGIIRNRQKVASAIKNAQAFLATAEEFGSFDAYIWRFTDGKTIQNTWKTQDQLPPATPLAETISKDMRKRGFTFFGPTICYAHMQATGMVNDHIVSCFRWKELQ